MIDIFIQITNYIIATLIIIFALVVIYYFAIDLKEDLRQKEDEEFEKIIKEALKEINDIVENENEKDTGQKENSKE